MYGLRAVIRFTSTPVRTLALATSRKEWVLAGRGAKSVWSNKRKTAKTRTIPAVTSETGWTISALWARERNINAKRNDLFRDYLDGEPGLSHAPQRQRQLCRPATAMSIDFNNTDWRPFAFSPGIRMIAGAPPAERGDRSPALKVGFVKRK